MSAHRLPGAKSLVLGILALAWFPASPTAQLSHVTVGDGVVSVGQFNGSDEQPFVAALAAAAGASGGVLGTQIVVLPGTYTFLNTVQVSLPGVTLEGPARPSWWPDRPWSCRS